MLKLIKRGFMTTTKENTHKNHRKRLKTKVKNFGINCLADHEILEYFLFYTIPRKDTNPIAHKLIERFGSFAKVLDAEYDDLMKVEGIGPESALLIHSLSGVLDNYKKSKSKEKKISITSVDDSVKFFRNNFEIKKKEFLVLTCLTKQKTVLKFFVYDGNDDAEITLELRRIANQINDEGVDSVILYHTHPNGVITPSLADIETTQRVVNVCMLNGINFNDHIIFNEAEHFSFHSNNLLETMKRNYQSVFNSTELYNKVSTKKN